MENDPKRRPSKMPVPLSGERAATSSVANYRELVDRVVDVFGDEIKASRWLSIPNPELGGMSPLQFAQQYDYDPASLEELLTRIEHGIYQ